MTDLGFCSKCSKMPLVVLLAHTSTHTSHDRLQIKKKTIMLSTKRGSTAWQEAAEEQGSRTQATSELRGAVRLSALEISPGGLAD